ncbi:XRE family transcriptional regulator [Nocardia otitidiscaviarum]|uniref:XRE family transcriptional regulator n=1 Tax=Nocardia otitidiscaviarum TaxID=1823 RepID=UPI001E60DFC6|nr:XRE family transcriptional regulator [Nocardia otitidiscaviarum]
MPPNVRLQQRREAVPSPVVSGRAMSRAELAEAVNRYLWRTRGERRDMDAHTIARYERGTIRWPNEGYREALRAVLEASDAELGFTPRRQRSATSAPNLFSPFDLGNVPDALVPLEMTTARRTGRIGMTDVTDVQAATRNAASAENLHGGGSVDSFAITQLRRFTPLLHGAIVPTARNALLEAIGNLSGVAGYAAFDTGDHATAERCFRFALWCADASGSWELRASSLADMARKTAYVGKPDDALSLIELAAVRADRLASTTRAMLGALRAQYLAATGRTQEALDEVTRADEHFAARGPYADPPWLCYYDLAEHLGSTGKALIPVAHERQRVELAASRIQQAIDLQGSDYRRSRTFSLTRLATLRMRLDDPREAAAIGLRAARDAATLSSQRLHNELGSLAAASARHRRIADVAELRHAIMTAKTM